MAVPFVAANAASSVVAKKAATKSAAKPAGTAPRSGRKPQTKSQGTGAEKRTQSPTSEASGSGGQFKQGLNEGLHARDLNPVNAGKRAGSVASDGAGVLLGFLLWVWVVLPFFNGKGARNVLRAKFTNKGPDGKELP